MGVLVRVWSRLLPPGMRDDWMADIHHAMDSGRGWVWLAEEIVRTPYLGLWRQHLRASRGRSGRPTWNEGGRGMGTSGWGRTGFGLGTSLGITLRALRRRPSFVAVAVLTLALSVGSATLVFSLVEGILIRTQPVERIADLYRVRGTSAAFQQHEVEIFRRSWNDLPISFEHADVLRNAPSVSDVTVYQSSTEPVDVEGRGRRETDGLRIGPAFFATLGVDPVIGRWPTRQEIDAFAKVVVIREGLWEQAYGRDPSALGSSLTINGEPHAIIGVAPAWFAVPDGKAEWWAPFTSVWAQQRTATVLDAIIRAESGIPADQLQTQLASRLDGLAESNPDYEGFGIRVIPLREYLTAGVAEGLRLLAGAVTLLLLVAGVNLVNLVVAHTARRLPELSLRSALGAGRLGLVGPILSELAVVAVCGGGLGVLLAYGALEPLTGFLTRTISAFPALADISINGSVLAFSLVATTALTFAAGLLSAFWASAKGPAQSLRAASSRSGGRGARKIQRALLVTEAGLAMILLAGAGLLARSTAKMFSVDPGFDPAGIAYVWASLPRSEFETNETVAAATAEIEQQLQSVPGLRVRAQASMLPSFGGGNLSPVRVTGTPPESDAVVLHSYVSPAYFDALSIPVLRGRGFDEGDRSGGEPVAVISESLAQQLFGDEDPVGRSLTRRMGAQLMGTQLQAAGSEEVLRVLGVVGDVRQLAIVNPPDPVLYRPLQQAQARSPFFMMEGVSSGAVLQQIEQAVSAVPGAVVVQSGYHRDALFRVVGHHNARTLLLVAIAILAGALATVGVYGVVAYVVSDQRRDIGVRMALGSRAGNEAGRMVREALAPTVVGAALGVLVAMAASDVLESSVFEVSTLDPVSYAATFGLLLAAAVSAAWIPARRAATVSPLDVLKEE